MYFPRIIKSTLQKALEIAKLHLLVEKFSYSFLKFIYTCKYIKWRRQQQLDDFYGYCRKNPERTSELNFHYYLIDEENLGTSQIDYLEFGVEKGNSMRWTLENSANPKSAFFGFDSFMGLPEKWEFQSEGTFSVNGKVPVISDPRCKIYSGGFHETLPRFLTQHTFNRKSVIYLDADIYSSTLYVLTTIAHRLKTGDILLLGDFDGAMHVFRAFLDFTAAYPVKLKLIAEMDRFSKVAFKVIE
ncbi:MAG: hypothetical protein GF315_00680 [candidate division Zixibacteria bacterium]|nr:hypothetical protein [candidate division Zixibacteria bacterium]